jgi:hypothetical protein
VPDPRLRRIPPPRTLTLESLQEVEAFRKGIARRWTLPRVRTALRLVRLSGSRNNGYERDINRLLSHTGWVAGSIGAVLLIGGAVMVPVPPAGPESEAGLFAWLSQVALATVLGWWCGRAAGIFFYRWRLMRLCRQIEAELSR